MQEQDVACQSYHAYLLLLRSILGRVLAPALLSQPRRYRHRRSPASLHRWRSSLTWPSVQSLLASHLRLCLQRPAQCLRLLPSLLPHLQAQNLDLPPKRDGLRIRRTYHILALPAVEAIKSAPICLSGEWLHCLPPALKGANAANCLWGLLAALPTI